MLLSGKVRWYDKKKGYGFVGTDRGDVFIHHSFFTEDFILDRDDIISFEIIDGEKGLRAKNISRAVV